MLKNLMEAVLSPLPKRNSVPPQKFSPSQSQGIVRRKTRQTKSNTDSDVPIGQSGRGRGRPPKDSVVKNKLKATQRGEKIQIKPTDGGHVVTLQAGTYEVFKKVLCSMYQSRQQTICGRPVVFGTPQENIIAHSTTIQMQSDGRQYTINLYHSTCRILANGKNPEQFYKDFIDIISFIRSGQQAGHIPVDDSVNEVLRRYLEEHLTSVNDSEADSGHSSDRGNTADPTHPEGARTTRTSNKTAIVQSTVRKKALNSNACNKSLPSSQLPAIQSNSNTSATNGNIVLEDLANVISNDNLAQANLHKACTQSPNPTHHSAMLNSEASFVDNSNRDAGFHDAPDNLISDPERPLIMHQGAGNAPTTPSTAGSPTDGQPIIPMQLYIPPPRDSKTDQPNDLSENRGQSEAGNQGTSNTQSTNGPKQLEDGSNQRGRGSRAKNKKAEEEMSKDELLAHLRKREAALQKKEDAVKLQAAKQDNLQRDLAHARAHIAMLEDKVKELEQDKRDLNQKLLIASNSGNTNSGPTYTHPQPTPEYQAPTQPPIIQPGYTDLSHQMDLLRLESKYSNELLQARHNHELQQIRHSQEIQNMRLQNAIEKLTPAQPQINSFAPFSPLQVLQHPHQMYYGTMPSGPFPLGGTPLVQQLHQSTKQPSKKVPYNQYVPNPASQPRNQQRKHTKSPKKPTHAEKEASPEKSPVKDNKAATAGSSQHTEESTSPEANTVPDGNARSSTSSDTRKSQSSDTSASPNVGNVMSQAADVTSEAGGQDFLTQTRLSNHDTMATRGQP